MDSCCFIEVAKGRIHKSDRAHEDDLWRIEAFLQAALDGELEILTSPITVAECQHAGDNVINDTIKRLFEVVLTSGRVAILAQCNLWIAKEARDLRWKHDILLGGADSIHVATAIEHKCKEFLTIEGQKAGKLVKQAKKIEKQFGLRVIKPRDTKFLPERYKQVNLVLPAQNSTAPN